MLKNKFWKALRSDRLKKAKRIAFSSASSFDELRELVRAEEYELKLNTGMQHTNLRRKRFKGRNQIRHVIGTTGFSRTTGERTKLQQKTQMAKKTMPTNFLAVSTLTHKKVQEQRKKKIVIE